MEDHSPCGARAVPVLQVLIMHVTPPSVIIWAQVPVAIVIRSVVDSRRPDHEGTRLGALERAQQQGEKVTEGSQERGVGARPHVELLGTVQDGDPLDDVHMEGCELFGAAQAQGANRSETERNCKLSDCRKGPNSETAM